MSSEPTQHSLSPETIDHEPQMLARARVLLQKGPVSEVISSLEEVGSRPLEASAWGLVLLESQRWDMLLATCIRALEYDPSNEGLMLMLSVALAAIGEQSEALVVLERVFELVPQGALSYKLALELAERFQAELADGHELSSLPTFNMSTPDELVDFTDTSLSIMKVREWLETPDDELDLDGPTENLSKSDLKQLLAVREAVDPEPTKEESLTGALSDYSTEDGSLEAFEQIKEVLPTAAVDAVGSSSWELSSVERELVGGLSSSEARQPLESMPTAQFDTLSVIELDMSSLEEDLVTNIAEEGGATRAIDHDELDEDTIKGDKAPRGEDETRALDAPPSEEVSPPPPSEESVITSAIPVVAPPRVPPPPSPPQPSAPPLAPAPPSLPPPAAPVSPPAATVPTPVDQIPPSVIMRARPPSLPPSGMPPLPRTRPLKAPPSGPLGAESDSFKLSPSTLAISEEPAQLTEAKTRSLTEETDETPKFISAASTRAASDSYPRFDSSPSTRALPQEPSSVASPLTRAQQRSEPLMMREPKPLTPKPLEELKAPELPASPPAQRQQSAPALGRSSPPSHIINSTTSMYDLSNDEDPLLARVMSGSSPLWALISTLALVSLSACALLIGLGFHQQRSALKDSTALSTDVSDDVYLELSGRLALDQSQPELWPLIFAHELSTYTGLYTEAGRELSALRAWTEMLLWVGYGRDTHQTQATEALMIALEGAPRSEYTLGAVSLYLSALSAYEGALKVAESIGEDRWWRGLTLGLVYERAGAYEEALGSLQQSDMLNPNATLTQQLILSIFDRYRSPATALEHQRRQGRFGVHAEQLIWAASSLMRSALSQGQPLEPPSSPLSPVEQSWVLSLLIKAGSSARVDDLRHKIIDQNMLESDPPGRLLPRALRYARLTLNRSLIEGAQKLIEDQYLQGLITLTERELALFELSLSKGDTRRGPLDARYTPHPRLQPLIPTLEALYPTQLKQRSFDQKLHSQHIDILQLDVERHLLDRSWSSLRVTIQSPQAVRIARSTHARLEAFTRSFTQKELKSLSHQFKLQRISLGRDPLTSSYPDELLVSYAMSEVGEAERAARFALSFSKHSSLSPEAQLNASLFVCRALDKAALLPSQWLSCKSSYERAPYRYDAAEGYALLLEELGALEEARKLMGPFLQGEQRGKLSSALQRLALRLGLQSQALNTGDAKSSVASYQAAIQFLVEGLYMSGARELAQLPNATRLERFEQGVLIARLQDDFRALEELAKRGSLAAQLYLWVRELKNSRSPSQLSLNAVIGSPQVARLTELVELMSCFAREGSLDLHHMDLSRSYRLKLKEQPPPKACRGTFHALLKGSFTQESLPPYAQHIAGLLFLSVGEVSRAEELWSGLLSDPVHSLEAQVAIGLLHMRQGLTRLAGERWARLTGEPSKLSSTLARITRR